MNAEKYFKNQWGSGFKRATLHEDGGILELSMKDIYETMEAFRAESKWISVEEVDRLVDTIKFTISRMDSHNIKHVELDATLEVWSKKLPKAPEQ